MQDPSNRRKLIFMQKCCNCVQQQIRIILILAETEAVSVLYLTWMNKKTGKDSSDSAVLTSRLFTRCFVMLCYGSYLSTGGRYVRERMSSKSRVWKKRWEMFNTTHLQNYCFTTDQWFVTVNVNAPKLFLTNWRQIIIVHFKQTPADWAEETSLTFYVYFY